MPSGSTRPSAVGTCVWVPTTALTRPSRYHPRATFSLGWHLDGRVTAVVGTHTHVPTADARVLPGGTAYITDVGMTGPRGGVIGVRKEQAIRGFVTHMNERYETSEDDPWLMGVLVRCSEAMRADSIEQRTSTPISHGSSSDVS